MAEYPRACGQCTRSSENKHFDCPPRMSDGRMFTDYGSRCDINYISHLKQSGKAMDSYTYRQFLLENADNIIDGMRTNAYMKGRCGPCVEPFFQGTMMPEKDIEVCDGRKCTISTVNPNGVGIGRYYGEESRYNPEFMEFKKREQEAFKNEANCCGSSADYQNYYPPNKESINRVAIIGGGDPLSGGDLIRASSSASFS